MVRLYSKTFEKFSDHDAALPSNLFLEECPDLDSVGSTCTLLVMDGVQQIDRADQEDINSALKWVLGNPNRKVIFVASSRVSLKPDPAYLLLEVIFHATGWTLEEYVAATRTDTFWTSVQATFPSVVVFSLILSFHSSS